MAKVKVLPSKDTIDSLRGHLDFYVHNGIVCVRKWPAKKGSGVTEAEKAHHPAFAYVNQLAGHLPDCIVTQWRAMVSGTNLTWKDLFVRAYIGYTFNPESYPRTIDWPEIPDHFAIINYQATAGTYYTHLEFWTDVACRPKLARLEWPPIKHIHSRLLRGNPNFKDLWWEWFAHAWESPLPAEDNTYHSLWLNKEIPHYFNGTFFAATKEGKWMSSISQYFSPQDLLLQ